MKLYHRELRDQKNAFFCNGEVKVDYINKQGHFEEDNAVKAKALLETHPEDIFAEGTPGYIEEVIAPEKEDSILLATSLKMEIEKLKEELEKAKASGVDTAEYDKKIAEKDDEIKKLTDTLLELKKEKDEVDAKALDQDTKIFKLEEVVNEQAKTIEEQKMEIEALKKKGK